MANKKPRKIQSERQNWYKFFNASVQTIKIQQTQLQYLVEDRKFLEEIIGLHNQRRASQVDMLTNKIFQMKEKIARQEMELKVAAAKADSLLGLTETEANFLKHKLENADSELADFREWVDMMSLKMSEHQDTSKIGNDKDGGNRLKALESEVKKLKCENEKLSREKKEEVSALLEEKKFVWNQYNKMESMFKEKLQEKSAALEQANQKIQTLLNNMEELHSSNAEKDSALVGLKRDLAKLESDSLKKSVDIPRLSNEAKLLKRSSRGFTTPLVRCTSGRGKNNASVTVKRELQTDEKVRSSKRKKSQVITITDSPPKLFTSAFKVPKLKNLATRSAM
ncbi:hypothetical protein Leryth_003606 [Lithospermum erythrorhizon]|nr:hypothetical protein Leryth_003606 [Lithospermum erythrorhizon]